MKVKVTEVCGEIFVNDELFHNCTTTLPELKEMWEDEKIWKDVDNICKSIIGDDDFVRSIIFQSLKNSPRKYTIEDFKKVIDMCYQNNVQIDYSLINWLNILPSEGLEVEIENNKIVKVYL